MDAGGAPGGPWRAEPPALSDPVDPGRARERTALAWMRSALSMLACAGLVARAGVSGHHVGLGLAAAVVLVAVAVAVAVVTWRHGEMVGRQPAIRVPTQTRAFRLLTVSTLLVAAVSLVVAGAL
jgi:uncharacterized membrane protein YidH (DUF202 family)